ncbi:MAG: alkaline phosphatase family protein, partial [Pseudomonadota bacterium]
MRVLLVGASGFDACIANRLADAGAMPAFAAFRAQAATGRLHVVHPPRGPLNWVSALTGAAPHEHGIAATMALDLETGVEQPVSMAGSPFKPVWRHYAERGKRAVAVNWPASSGFEAVDGEIIVGDRFFDADHGTPVNEAADAIAGPAQRSAGVDLSKLLVTARDLDRATLATFVPRLDLVEATGDQRIERLASALTRAFSVHAVSTHLLETEPSDLAAVHYELLQQLSDDFLLYAAPQHDAVSDRDHAVWGAVVDAGYRVFDLFLARLAALAGPACRIALVADSGYRTGADRPAFPVRTQEEADNWRNDQGFAAILGPGVVATSLVGAHIRGLASTVCTLGGLEEAISWQLPAWLSFSNNMERAFEIGDGGEQTVANAAMLWSQTEMARLHQLLGAEGHGVAARALLEARYAMAQSLRQVGQIAQAAAILEQIVTLQPHAFRWQSTYFELNLVRRDFDAAQRQIEAAVESALDPVLIAVARAQLLLAQREPEAAIEVLQTAPTAALALRTKADCHARLGQ